MDSQIAYEIIIQYRTLFFLILPLQIFSRFLLVLIYYYWKEKKKEISPELLICKISKQISTLYQTNNKHSKGVCSVLQLQRCNWITGTDSHVCTDNNYLCYHVTPSSMMDSGFWLLGEKKSATNTSCPIKTVNWSMTLKERMILF